MRAGRSRIALCAVFWTAAALAVMPACAQNAPAREAPAPQAPPADPPPAAQEQPDSLRTVGRGLSGPTFVMLRSLVVPGWGQLKNRAWLKALLVAGIEGALIERLLFEDRVSGDFASKAALFPEDSAERARFEWKSEKHSRHRRDFTWWTAIFIVLSMGDAYVDAHLKRFDVRVQTEPEEEGAAPESRANPRFAVRLGLRLAP